MRNLCLVLLGSSLFALLMNSPNIKAAKRIDLRRDSITHLQWLFLAKQGLENSMQKEGKTKQKQSSAFQDIQVCEKSRQADFNQTLHVRLQEMYLNYPVIGGEFIMHIPRDCSVSSLICLKQDNAIHMDGYFYQKLAEDLAQSTAIATHPKQIDKAFEVAVRIYKGSRTGIQNKNIQAIKKQLVVYIGKDRNAHWAFQISFYVPSLYGALPAMPHYILDAVSFLPYAAWDEIKTQSREENGGGIGGNIKIGQLFYDGLPEHLPALKVQRDPLSQQCFLHNAHVRVKNVHMNQDITFACVAKDDIHNHVYWNHNQDTVNGAYSPSNDVLFFGSIIYDMYKKWYHLTVLEQKGKPLPLVMMVHANLSNAYWDEANKVMLFGDGDKKTFFPLTSLGVTAHEISHGFTGQHANLVYKEESGGINEAFSDMAAMVSEFYVHGKNKWQLGEEILKSPGVALRYFDQPSRDCSGATPGYGCSIDTFTQYYPELDVHYSSGIYNRAFYLLATSPGWTVKKAFAVMVQANRCYWVPNSTFATGACGVLSATKDYGYATQAVHKAFKQVGIDTSDCLT